MPQFLVSMRWFLASFAVIDAADEVITAASKFLQPLSPGDAGGSKQEPRILGEMAYWVPQCPYGTVDQTGGHARFWACGLVCPGTLPWADDDCNCACVKPDEYRQIMVERAKQALASAAPAPPPAQLQDTAPSRDAYVAGPAAAPSPQTAQTARASGSTNASPAPSPDSYLSSAQAGAPPDSWGPAPQAQPATTAAVVAAAGVKPTLKATLAPSTSTKPALKEETSEGLSGAAIALVCICSITCFGCCLAAVALWTLQLQRKSARVEPAKLHSESRIAKLPPVKVSCPPVQHYVEQGIQPRSQFPRVAPCQDLSVISQMQRQTVINGGWTPGLNGPGSRPCSTHSPSLKPTSPQPSIRSDASTRSPSALPSSASAGSKSPTPPSLEGH